MFLYGMNLMSSGLQKVAGDKMRRILTAMTTNAQGITRQFLELRTRETTLAADIAGREADVRGLEESLQQTEQSERAAEQGEDERQYFLLFISRLSLLHRKEQCLHR